MVPESEEKYVNTQDILQGLYGEDFYQQEVSYIEDEIDNEVLHDIWIEIEPDSVYAASIEEGFVLCQI